MKSIRRTRRTMACVVFCALVSVSITSAQNSQQERTLHASKDLVERALRDLDAERGGKLPALEGFATSREDALDKYQRGYYSYSIKVDSVSSAETIVRVSAKITAWYKGDSAADSGYRILPSNGRLESDLLDNLDDALKSTSLNTSSTRVSAPSAPTWLTPGDRSSHAPDAPSSTHQSSILKSRVTASSISHSPQDSPDRAEDDAAERRAQKLIVQGNSLRDILRNRTRPSNLAVIKESKTPILERPLEGSKTILIADAEDEFQIIDTVGDWVHVQVSGVSRGWLRRDQVDAPAASAASLSTPENDPPSFDRAPSFHQTREEILVFPGKWEPLDGKKVKIIWIQPLNQKSFGTEAKLKLVKSVFQNSLNDASGATPPLAGVVVILDSEDGGMAATTMATLQQWHARHLPDGAFWKRCLLDPADAFKAAE